MDYDLLLKVATELGYQLSVSGAETFRIEESINRILKTYDVTSEVFAIPNCLIVSIETPEGKLMTRGRSHDPDAAHWLSRQRSGRCGMFQCHLPRHL